MASKRPKLAGPAQAAAESTLAASGIWSLITGTQAQNWSRLLVRDHASPQARLALFQACREGRNLVLAVAERAAMTLRMSATDDLPLSMRSVQGIRSALLARSSLPTKLRLEANTLKRLTMVLGKLQGGTTFLEELLLFVPPASADQRLSTSLLISTTLTTLAHICPNLQGLTMDARVDALPRPNLLPRLRELAVRIPVGSEGGIMRTTAPYIKQLTTLALAPAGPQPVLDPTFLPLLLNPTTVGTHLHTLHIAAALNDTLLGLLLQCTPALTHLKVHTLQLASDMHAQSQAAWQHLEIQSGMHLSSLARLPLTAGMQLIMATGITCDISTAHAAAQMVQALARFKGVAFRSAHPVALGPGGLRACDQPAALRLGFKLLHALPTTISRIALAGWVMSPALVLELQGLPTWGGILVGAVVWLPQPHLYTSLLSHLPGSFHEVCIQHNRGLTPAHYISLCMGAPRGRTAEAPLHIMLWHGCALTGAIQHNMQQLGVYPNVTVGTYQA